MQPEEWKIAVAQAKERAEGPTWKYLLEMELLPDYLEDALSAFGRSCEGLGSADAGLSLPARNQAGAVEPSRPARENQLEGLQSGSFWRVQSETVRQPGSVGKILAKTEGRVIYFPLADR